MLAPDLETKIARFALRAAIALAFGANAGCIAADVPTAPLPTSVAVAAEVNDVVIDFLELENGAKDTIEMCLRDVVIVSDEGGSAAMNCGFANLRACLVMQGYTRVRGASFHSGVACPNAHAGTARVLADISFRRKRGRDQEPWQTATLLAEARIEMR